MPLNELTITLSASGRLSVETLTAALENALEMLRNLEPEFVESGTPVRWEVVRVRMRSPLRMTLAPRIVGKASASVGRKIVRAALRGVEAIEHAARPPEHFNEDSLEAARKLLAVATKDGAALTFSSNGKDEVKLTEQAAKHIAEVVAKAPRYSDVSTVEGNLETVSIRGHPSLFICDPLTNDRIECLVNEDQLAEGLKLLQRRVRVAVLGTVNYRNHVPKTIKVESFEVLPGMAELPQPQQMEPIDITRGLSSEEHVRRMRDA